MRTKNSAGAWNSRSNLNLGLGYLNLAIDEGSRRKGDAQVYICGMRDGNLNLDLGVE
jgi:hypothetical protein